MRQILVRNNPTFDQVGPDQVLIKATEPIYIPSRGVVLCAIPFQFEVISGSRPAIKFDPSPGLLSNNIMVVGPYWEQGMVRFGLTSLLPGNSMSLSVGTELLRGTFIETVWCRTIRDDILGGLTIVTDGKSGMKIEEKPTVKKPKTRKKKT